MRQEKTLRRRHRPSSSGSPWPGPPRHTSNLAAASRYCALSASCNLSPPWISSAGDPAPAPVAVGLPRRPTGQKGRTGWRPAGTPPATGKIAAVPSFADQEKNRKRQAAVSCCPGIVPRTLSLSLNSKGAPLSGPSFLVPSLVLEGAPGRPAPPGLPRTTRPANSSWTADNPFINA